jgi:hypothetical protein
MYQNRTLFLIAASAITLSLLASSSTFATPVMASSKGGGGPVSQEQVSSGNSNLDKEINKFYSCISKTHQDPPSIEKVDNCYYQALGGSVSISSSTTHTGVVRTGNNHTSTSASTSTSTSHTHHKHGLSGTSGGGTT